MEAPFSFKKLRYGLEYLGCRLVAWGIPLLSRGMCVRLARGLGALAYRLDGRGRRVALANLALVFGDRYTEAEREGIARRAYQTFARSIFDLFWSPRLNAENWRDYLTIEGDLEALKANMATHSAVILTVHWGNFEWGSLAFGFLGYLTTIVTETFKNPQLTQIFADARGSNGHTIIPQEGSMVRLLKTVKRGGFAGMLIDLNLRPDQAAATIDAFGRKMSVTLLHSVLVQRGGALIVPMRGESLPDGRCRVTIDAPLTVPPESTPQQIAQLCWDHFAPVILQRPELYMWAYKHWRYRPRNAPPESYPFYANTNGKFEELLKRG